MTPVPDVSVVVVSYNTRDDLLRCLASLRAHLTMPYEAVVVDNASTDDSPEAVRSAFPETRILVNPENVGFARANNRGIREGQGEYVLVLNSDAEIRPGAVEAMVGILRARAEVGIVGPRTVGSEGRIQVSFGPALSPLAEVRQRRLVRGVREGEPDALRLADDRSRKEGEPDWVSGSCLLARRTALEAVGGFDEAFFLYEEDVDLCVRVRGAGWRIVYTPAAEIVHHLGRSMDRTPARARIEYHRSHLRYYRKHQPLPARVVLRASLAGRAAALYASGLGGGPESRDRRHEAAALLRLVLFD